MSIKGGSGVDNRQKIEISPIDASKAMLTFFLDTEVNNNILQYDINLENDGIVFAASCSNVMLSVTKSLIWQVIEYK